MSPALGTLWLLLSTGSRVMTCDTLVPINFALEFDSLQLVLQDQLVCLTNVLDSCWLGQEVELKAKEKQKGDAPTITTEVRS